MHRQLNPMLQNMKSKKNIIANIIHAFIYGKFGRKASLLFPKIIHKAIFKRSSIVPKSIFKYKQSYLKDVLKYGGNKYGAYNINALNLDDGISVGHFNDKRYLMKVRPGDLIESNILIYGCWEPHILKLIHQILQKNPHSIMIDVGANIGATSIPLANCNSDIHFYCFEPHPQVFTRLSQNVHINGLSNIFSINAAVSEGEEFIEFFAQQPSDNMGLSSIRLNYDIGKHETVRVANYGLDEYFSDRTTTISLLKIDTQGAESQVLNSAKNIIAKDRPVIIFEIEDEYFSSGNEKLTTKQQILNILAANNYSLYAITNAINFLPKIDLLSNYHGDLLAIPN
jgi:FkbM family methyltransferase